MSLLTADGNHAVIVRRVDAEIVGGPLTTVQLLADASQTGGALTTQRVTLTTGADKGEATLEELLDSQDLYDNHFLDSPAWRAARAPEATG